MRSRSWSLSDPARFARPPKRSVEIVSVISLFGYLNRWNDTMATALEDEPVAFADRAIRAAGWDGGKHMQAAE